MDGENNVTMVTVTYGKRGALLRRVVAAALRCGVTNVVVVANGSDAEALNPEEYNIRTVRVILLVLQENTGSAGGFAAGLKCALELPDCEWIWLLDDDNEPASDALTALLSAQELLAEKPLRTGLALLSFRSDRSWQSRLLAGAPARLCFAPPDSCCGFHVRELWDAVTGERRRLRHRLAEAPDLQPYAEVEYAPYGGLFIHRRLLGRIGLPDERLFLYADDTDFTLRIGRVGAKLFLVRDSRIRDLEHSWGLQRYRRKTLFSRLLMEGDDTRVLYGVRNGIYVERRWRGVHKGIFLINMVSFCVLLFAFAAVLRRPRRAMLILRALRAGLRGNLSSLLPQKITCQE